MTQPLSPVTEQTVRPFIESALRWHAVFDDGRGGNDLTLDQTADLITARLIAAIGAPAQEARVPKVRTSHHRNKEEAARLQELVDKRYAPAQRQKPTCDELVTEIRKIRRQLGGFDYASCEVDLAKLLLAGILAPAQSTLERIPHDDNTRLATIAECAKVADDHSRSNKTAANNMFEAGGQKSAILFMESARACDEIAAKLRALSVTSTERVGSLFPDIGEQEPETILDSGECDCYVWPGCCPYCGGQPSTVTRP